MDNKNELYNSIFESLKEVIKDDYKSIVVWMTSFSIKSTMLEVYIKNRNGLWVSAFNVKCNKDKMRKALNEINLRLNSDRNTDNWKTSVYVINENNEISVKYFYEDIADNSDKASIILKNRYLV